VNAFASHLRTPGSSRAFFLSRRIGDVESRGGHPLATGAGNEVIDLSPEPFGHRLWRTPRPNGFDVG